MPKVSCQEENEIAYNLYHNPIIMEFIISQVENNAGLCKVFNDDYKKKKKYWFKTFSYFFSYFGIMLITDNLSLTGVETIDIAINGSTFIFFCFNFFKNLNRASKSKLEILENFSLNPDVDSLKKLKSNLKKEEFDCVIDLLKNKKIEECIYTNIMNYINDKSKQNEKDLLTQRMIIHQEKHKNKIEGMTKLLEKNKIKEQFTKSLEEDI